MWHSIFDSLIAPTIIAAATWTGHRIVSWFVTKTGSDFQRKLNESLSAARSVIEHIGLTATANATTEWLVQQAKGAIAIQLARVGIDPANKIVVAARDALISSMVTEWARTHLDESKSGFVTAKQLSTGLAEHLSNGIAKR